MHVIVFVVWCFPTAVAHSTPEIARNIPCYVTQVHERRLSCNHGVVARLRATVRTARLVSAKLSAEYRNKSAIVQ